MGRVLGLSVFSQSVVSIRCLCSFWNFSCFLKPSHFERKTSWNLKLITEKMRLTPEMFKEIRMYKFIRTYLNSPAVHIEAGVEHRCVTLALLDWASDSPWETLGGNLDWTGGKSPLCFPMGIVPFLLHSFLTRIAEKENDIIPKELNFILSHSSWLFSSWTRKEEFGCICKWLKKKKIEGLNTSPRHPGIPDCQNVSVNAILLWIKPLTRLSETPQFSVRDARQSYAI